MSGIADRTRRTSGGDRWRTVRRAVGWISRSYVVIVLLGIVIGLQVAPVVSDLTAGPVSGTVAVVTLSGGINGANAASVGARLKRVREDPEIEAVVLRVNSGGGGASASEEIYMEVKRTAERMPVVVSINSIAASGAYYSAAPADVIFAKPTSFVGSVGVYFTAPQSTPPIDILITTGPNKLSGGDLRGWQYQVETARRAFAGAVIASRGDALELTEEELSYAKLYSGAGAVDNGLVDEIGGLQDAINRAAGMAGLQRHRTRLLGYDSTVSFVTQTAYIAAETDDKELISPAYFTNEPGSTAVPNLLMLPPSVVERAIADEIDRANATGVNATDAASAG